MYLNGIMSWFSLQQEGIFPKPKMNMQTQHVRLTSVMSPRIQLTGTDIKFHMVLTKR